MRKLFAFAYDQAAKGYEWDKTPPGSAGRLGRRGPGVTRAFHLRPTADPFARRPTMHVLLARALLPAALCAGTALWPPAHAQGGGDDWRLAATVYLWAPVFRAKRPAAPSWMSASTP